MSPSFTPSDNYELRHQPVLQDGAVDPRILSSLLSLLSEGRSVVLATVISTKRSVPRRTGAKMLVADDGHRIGSVGGGEMESRVVEEASHCLADGNSRLLDYRLVDPDSGDPGVCGGEVTIYLEPHMPPPTILVIGCGHVGRAVVDLASWLGFRVIATDDRPEAAESLADGLPSGSNIVVKSGLLTDVLADLELTEADHAVLVTRNVQVDVENLPHLLSTNVGTVGVMGSKRRWETTKESLVAAGVSDSNLERVTSPIGMEIGAETPEEIAVSILAQVVARQRAGSQTT